MKKLIECVDVKYSDGTFLLVPRQANEMDLVMLGFDGTEKWYRLECVQNHCYGLGNGSWNYIATICRKDDATFSWHWGFDGYTLISKGLENKQQKIVEACKMYCEQNEIYFPGYTRRATK